MGQRWCLDHACGLQNQVYVGPLAQAASERSRDWEQLVAAGCLHFWEATRHEQTLEEQQVDHRRIQQELLDEIARLRGDLDRAGQHERAVAHEAEEQATAENLKDALAEAEVEQNELLDQTYSNRGHCGCEHSPD